MKTASNFISHHKSVENIFQLNTVLFTKRCGRLLIAQNGPDSWIQKICQATKYHGICLLSEKFCITSSSHYDVSNNYCNYNYIFMFTTAAKVSNYPISTLEVESQ